MMNKLVKLLNKNNLILFICICFNSSNVKADIYKQEMLQLKNHMSSMSNIERKEFIHKTVNKYVSYTNKSLPSSIDNNLELNKLELRDNVLERFFIVKNQNAEVLFSNKYVIENNVRNELKKYLCNEEFFKIFYENEGAIKNTYLLNKKEIFSIVLDKKECL